MRLWSAATTINPPQASFFRVSMSFSWFLRSRWLVGSLTRRVFGLYARAVRSL